MKGRVVEVRRFPVKSMLGEMPREVTVGESGVAGDRAHAVVDQETGKVASAKMPRRWGRLLAFSARYLDRPEAGAPVEVRFPDGAALRSDAPDFDARLSTAVGRTVRMMAAPEPDAGYEDEWPDVEGIAPQDFIESTNTSTSDDGLAVSTLPVGLMAPGTFQDLAPITILTTAALREVERLTPESRWDARRFRSNFLIETDGTGFIENDWVGRQLRIGEVVLQVPAPIPRCVMTTLPQEDLPADREILKTVARHNRVDAAGMGRFACLGAYGAVMQGGRVSIGDDVELLP